MSTPVYQCVQSRLVFFCHLVQYVVLFEGCAERQGEESCLHVDFLMCVCSDKHTLAYLTASLHYLRILLFSLFSF